LLSQNLPVGFQARRIDRACGNGENFWDQSVDVYVASAERPDGVDVPFARHHMMSERHDVALEKEEHMTDVRILVINLAKHSFQICATAAGGAVLFNRMVSRAKLETALRDQPSVDAPSNASNGLLFFVCPPWQASGPTRPLLTRVLAALSPLAKSFIADAVALRHDARRLGGPSDLSSHRGGRSCLAMDLHHH
jgi:hypothetical protein